MAMQNRCRQIHDNNTQANFWNSLLTTNNALLSKINEADLRLVHRKGIWTYDSCDMRSYWLYANYLEMMCTSLLS